MSRREAWVAVAVITAALSACRAEDSVAPNLPSVAGASPVTGNTAGSGGSGPGSTGAGGMGAGGSAGATPGGGVGATGGNMAGAGGSGLGGSAGSMVGAGNGGAVTGGSGGSASSGTARDADCDMNGIWVVRMMSVTEALTLEQCASIYYYLELKHEGENVEVVNQFNCGIEGRGSSNGSLNDATMRALMPSNSQIGRKGTMTKGPDGTCQFKMDRFWVVFGADEAVYAPSPRNAEIPFTQEQASKPLPTTATGAIDFENDGKPGMAIVVTGAISGIRHSVQRASYVWLTNDRYKIMPSLDWATDIEAHADYYGEEVAIEVEPADAVLLSAGANPVPTAQSARATFRFLGRNASDPRVAALVVSADPKSDGALQTCKNIVKALPPIDAIATDFGQVCPCPGGGMCM